MLVMGRLGEEVNPIVDQPEIAIGAIWDDINAYCQTKATPDQCRALLGWRPIYFPPIVTEKPVMPFWALLLIGYVAGKHNVL